MTGRRISRLRFIVAGALPALLSLVVVGCSSPTPSLATPTLGPKPQPTLLIAVNPPAAQVEEGKTANIAVQIDPYEKATVTWSVVGTSGGKVAPDSGEDVIYTAGTEGTDTVIAEGQTAGGTPFKLRRVITVARAPQVDSPVTPSSALTSEPEAGPSLATYTVKNLKAGQEVPCSNQIQGTYPPDVTGRVWPVVYVGNAYHPHGRDEDGKAPDMLDGLWWAPVRFGDCNVDPSVDAGKTFVFMLVVADDSANQRFEAYLAHGRATDEWPGLPSLPDGAKEVIPRFPVIRQ